MASKTFEEHVDLLDCLFKKLIEVGFTLSLKKSRFFCDTVKFLGVIIDREGVRVDPEKVDTIQNFPIPRDRKQLQGFLGVCGYSGKFVRQHVDYIVPFRDLLKPNVSWSWTESHDQAFEAMKRNFLNSVVLHHMLPGKGFRLQTDASDMGISGVLYQVDSEGESRIVALTSRVLTKCEVRYTVTEKELLAIVYSLLKFRRYLLGTSFEIVTDHQALTFLLKTPYHNARLMRWVLFMQEYDYSILHCKGSENVMADFFSRNFKDRTSTHTQNNNHFVREIVKICTDELENKKNDVKFLARLEMKKELLNDLKSLPQLQKDDGMIKCLREKVPTLGEFREESGVLYHRSKNCSSWKLMIPSCSILALLSSIHCQLGHAGSFKMQKYINKFFFWRYMARDIKKFTRGCDLCQRTKYLNFRMEGAYNYVGSSTPNDLVTVDFFGSLPMSIGGVQFIFVVQDTFSKIVKLYPIKRAVTKICLDKLINDYFINVGIPKKILADNGTQFTSHLWRLT